MLQLTRKADYGLRLMLEVAAHGEGALKTAEIARRQQIPYQFLRKVAQALVSKGLLASERGVRGGLALARPAESISVLDIVRALGPISLNRCLVDPPRCDRRRVCAVYPLWVDAQSEVERVLGGATLLRLAGSQSALERRGYRRGAGRRAALAAAGERA